MRKPRTNAGPLDLIGPLTMMRSRTGGRDARFHALGRTDAGRMLHVTFTLRYDDTMIRVISARPMHRRERLRYEEET